MLYGLRKHNPIFKVLLIWEIGESGQPKIDTMDAISFPRVTVRCELNCWFILFQEGRTFGSHYLFYQ